MTVRVAPSAIIAPGASLGQGTTVWHFAQVREGARLGAECIVGTGAYVDVGVVVGDRCKIENNASLFAGTVLEDGVFVGPHVCFTNDRIPRAVNPDGTLKRASDWEVGAIRVHRGAAVGSGAIVLPGVTIGAFALVGAGSVVTRDVPPFALVFGNPARQHGWICKCGRQRSSRFEPDAGGEMTCGSCR